MQADQFKHIYLPHKASLYRMAIYLMKNREDAEDVVQDTYATLWNNREDLKTVVNSEAYSITILKRLCYDRLNSLYKRSHNIPIDSIELESKRELKNQIEARSQLVLIERHLKDWPESQRTVFILRHYKGLPLGEIAEQTGLSLSNVKVILSRMRRELKERMNKL